MTQETRCLNPNEISAEDRVAFANGEAGEAIAGHIARCEFCRSEAEEYARVARTLLAGLFRRSCPSADVLGDYALSLLPEEETVSAAQHLVDCQRCLDEMRSIQAFVDSPDEEPSPGLGGAIVRTLRRLVAVPVSRQAAAAAGLRGTTGREAQLFTADDFFITVEVLPDRPGSARSVVTGLLERSGADIEGGTAELFIEGETLANGPIDSGNFEFSGLRSGTYRLELNTSDAAITVEALRVP
jgi:hypothetical protein